MSEALRTVLSFAAGAKAAGGKRGAVRRTLVQWHRWLALALSLPLLVQAGTGVVLVFKPELVAQLATPRMAAGGAGEPGAFTPILESVAATYPQAEPTRVDFPSREGAPYVVHLHGPGGPGFVAAFPNAGLAEMGPAAAALETVRSIHDELSRPGLGQAVVAVSGVSMVLLGVSGLIVWWPGLARLVASLRFPAKGNARQLLFQWHRSLGALVGLFLILIGATGASLSLNTWLSRTPWRPIDGPPALTAEARVEAARRMLPGLVVRDVRIAPGGLEVERVLLISPGRTGPVSQVRFDPETGVPRAVADARTFSAGEAFWAWLYPVHTAQAGGLAARLALLAAGVSAVVMIATGLALWAVRRPRRAAGGGA